MGSRETNLGYTWTGRILRRCGSENAGYHQRVGATRVKTSHRAVWAAAWTQSLFAMALIVTVTTPPNYAPPVGALNPQVTQANISVTICKPGWTRTIRPAVSYTNALKLKQMKERQLPGRMQDYEEDHLVSLELGGHPTNLLNLWPQLWKQARVKDKWETSLNRAVCALRMTL